MRVRRIHGRRDGLVGDLSGAGPMARRGRGLSGMGFGAFAVLIAVMLTPLGPARSADAPGLLDTIHRHITQTTTITNNGDLNPYAVVVAPATIGKVQQGDVLVDNFNNVSNLQ